MIFGINTTCNCDILQILKCNNFEISLWMVFMLACVQTSPLPIFSEGGGTSVHKLHLCQISPQITNCMLLTILIQCNKVINMVLQINWKRWKYDQNYLSIWFKLNGQAVFIARRLKTMLISKRLGPNRQFRIWILKKKILLLYRIIYIEFTSL